MPLNRSLSFRCMCLFRYLSPISHTFLFIIDYRTPEFYDENISLEKRVVVHLTQNCKNKTKHSRLQRDKWIQSNQFKTENCIEFCLDLTILLCIFNSDIRSFHGIYVQCIAMKTHLIKYFLLQWFSSFFQNE